MYIIDIFWLRVCMEMNYIYILDFLKKISVFLKNFLVICYYFELEVLKCKVYNCNNIIISFYN